MAKKGTRGRGIQSLETGLKVLSALAASEGPAALSAVANRAGLSASQAYRHLTSLIATGMAKQDGDTGLYDLDGGAVRLGLSALSRLDVFGQADGVFAALAKKTGRTYLLSVWGDNGATIVRWYPGNPPVITPLYIGSTLPLLQSSTGQVFYAFGNSAEMDAHARREIRRTHAQIDLKAMKRNVRATFGAEVDSTMIPGLRADAAPVFDLQGHLALVATAVAASTLDTSGDKAARTALHDACRKVTEAIGGHWAHGCTTHH
ncbi:MAG: IclR family transcriptional regulator [Bradyrhizobium sp.]